MPIGTSVGVGGTHRAVAQIKVGVSSAWRTVANAWVGVGGVWKQIHQSFAVDYPARVLGTGSGFGVTGPVDTGTAWTAPTYAGGSGSYTYSWSYVSGDNTIGIAFATHQRPQWSHAGVPTTGRTAYWQVTVTDTTYGTIAQDTVEVRLEWSDLA